MLTSGSRRHSDPVMGKGYPNSYTRADCIGNRNNDESFSYSNEDSKHPTSTTASISTSAAEAVLIFPKNIPRTRKLPRRSHQSGSAEPVRIRRWSTYGSVSNRSVCTSPPALPQRSPEQQVGRCFQETKKKEGDSHSSPPKFPTRGSSSSSSSDKEVEDSGVLCNRDCLSCFDDAPTNQTDQTDELGSSG